MNAINRVICTFIGLSCNKWIQFLIGLLLIILGIIAANGKAFVVLIP